jgi:hypothetical protein
MSQCQDSLTLEIKTHDVKVMNIITTTTTTTIIIIIIIIIMLLPLPLVEMSI